VALAFAIAVIVLLAGTSSDLAVSVLDLPTAPGSDLAIDAAQRLDTAMRAAGIDRPHAALRAGERALEALRFPGQEP
jgi:hypothetical protein